MSDFKYEDLIVDVPDYPKPGVVFKDIMPLLSDKDGLHAVVTEIADHFKDKGITKVLGAEARGFLIGAPVAYALGAGFVSARKPGKLPREVFSETYALEYGTDELQILADAISEDDKVLILDDLVATAGTTLASARLVEKSGAEIVGFAYLIELAFLHPRETVAKEYAQEFFSLIQVD